MKPWNLNHFERTVLVCLFFVGIGKVGWAEPDHVIVLDCTNSNVPSDLTSKSSTVLLPLNHFDDSAFGPRGEITQADFNGLTRTALKKPKIPIRFFTKKNEEVEVFIVTSIPVETSEQLLESPVPPPVLLVSGPVTLKIINSGGPGQPKTAASQPITFSTLQTVRFLLEEQKRPTALEAGHSETVSYYLGLTFKSARPETRASGLNVRGQKVYYYHHETYKLKSQSGILKLSFQNQTGALQNIAQIITGPSENWFLAAGGPVHSYTLDTNDSSNTPTGLYLSLNYSIHDIYDPGPRWLIVNFLDVNTTNPTAGIGLIGLGVGFPKMNDFVPLSTLSVTETLLYNFNLSQMQVLTLINYDIGDIFQLFR